MKNISRRDAIKVAAGAIGAVLIPGAAIPVVAAPVAAKGLPEIVAIWGLKNTVTLTEGFETLITVTGKASLGSNVGKIVRLLHPGPGFMIRVISTLIDEKHGEFYLEYVTRRKPCDT